MVLNLSHRSLLFHEEQWNQTLRSAPYHPASNGLAECFIQSFKQSMKAMVKDGLPMHAIQIRTRFDLL